MSNLILSVNILSVTLPFKHKYNFICVPGVFLEKGDPIQFIWGRYPVIILNRYISGRCCSKII